MDIKFSPEIYNFDIFAKNISLFYNNKDKIGSYFGLILTILYIISSLSIFIFFLIFTYQREDFHVSDSMIYSHHIPTFKLNSPNSFYCIIGVSNKNKSRYIDESIYRISAIYYNQYKDINGDFVNKEILQLPIERCKKEKYKTNVLNGIEFNNSYCIGDFDVSLIGERIYNNYSFIEIQIYQCFNNSENNNICKSQEIIDETLESGQFSIQLKNIELNPNNYSFPIHPTVYEFFSSISKYFYKNIFFLYKIAKVESYTGLFYEKQSITEDLKLDDIKEDINYMSNNKIISKINIGLRNGIHIQKRIYKNIFDVLAITGGYMNIIYCLFYLISFIYNNFKFETLIVNSLLNMDIKYEKKYPSRFKDKRNNTIFIDNSNKELCNINLQGNKVTDIQKPSEKIDMPITNFKRGSLRIESLFRFKSKKNITNKISLFNDISQFSFMDHSNNASRAEIMPRPVEMKLVGSRNFGEQSMNFGNQSINLSINKSINKSIDKSINKSENKSLNRSMHKSSKFIRNYSIFYDNLKKKKMKDVKLSIFGFYFGKILNKKKELELLNKCTSIYKEKMDLINLFRDLVIFENVLQDSFHFEKNGLNDEIKIFSSKKIS